MRGPRGGYQLARERRRITAAAVLRAVWSENGGEEEPRCRLVKQLVAPIVESAGKAFLDELETAGVRISVDGKGRFLDNIFIERLWRSLKYEEVFIKAYGSVIEARRGIGGWLSFYNEERPHQALGYRTPRAVFAGAACEHVDNPSASLRDAPALPTCSRLQHQEKEVLMYCSV